MKKRKACTPDRLSRIERLLVPGGASCDFVNLRERRSTESDGRWFCYALLSSISAAIRERAEDQRRSTVRGEISSASAVSAVVKPAK